MDAVISEHIRTVRNHLYDGKAALFVGAGFSKNAQPRFAQTSHHFKSWPEVTDQLSARLWGEEHWSSQPEMSRDPLWVAQRYEEEFGAEAFYNELRRAIPSSEFRPSDLHRQLLSMDWRTILTTNLDTLLEDTLEELGKPHDVIVQDIDIPLASDALKLYKMHGCITQPSTVVFTEEQYRRYERDHPLLTATLKALFAQYTVLFVGFSLTDPNFRVVYGWVRDVLSKYQRKAYALLPDHEIEHHVREYWSSRNVILLPIDIASGAADGYEKGLRPYLQYFDWSPIDEAVEKDKKQIEGFLTKYKVSNSATVDFSDMKQNLARLPRVSTNAELDYYFSVALPETFRQLWPQIKALEGRARYDISALWSELLPLGTLIEDTDLTNYLIGLLRAHNDWGMSATHARYLLQKSRLLIAQGLYRDAEELLDNSASEHSPWPPDFEIDRLWTRILRAKLELDFPRLESLAKELVRHHVPDDPTWFNRVGNLFRILGDFPRAQDYFVRAEHSAKRRRDKWQLYVAYENLSRFWDYVLSHPQIEKQRQKLISEGSLPDPNPYSLLKDLRERATGHALWAHEHPDGGWSSEQKAIPDSFLRLVGFINDHGLPDDLVTGNEYEPIGVHLLAEGRLDDAARFAIVGLHRTVIYRIVEPIRVIEDRDRLFELSLGVMKSVGEWLDTIGAARNLWFARRCLVGAAAIFCELAPSSSRNQIEVLTQLVAQLLDRVCGNKQLLAIDGALPRELIALWGVLMAVNPACRDAPAIGRWINELAPNLHWHWPNLPFEKVPGRLTLTQATVRTLIESHAFGFLYRLLEAQAVDDETRATILNMVYIDVAPDPVSDTAFYLLPYFESNVDRARAAAIISAQIDRHAERSWTSDAAYIHQLVRVASLIPSNRLEDLLRELEHKTKSVGPWNDRAELVTAYLVLIHELYLQKLLPSQSRFLDTFQENRGQLTEAFVRVFDWKDLPRDEVIAELNYGLALMDPVAKRRYLYLAGYWLKTCDTLNEGERSLVDAIRGAFHDSDGTVVRAALGAATMFLDGPCPWRQEYLAKIVEKMKPIVDSQQVWVLTALAGLYAVLKNPANVGLEEGISTVQKSLENCSYVAVQTALSATGLLSL